MRDQVILATWLIEDLLELWKSINDLLNGFDTNDASSLSANKQAANGSDTREAFHVGVQTEAVRTTPHVFAIHLAKGLVARTLGSVELADQVEVGVDVDILPEGMVKVAAGPDANLQLDVRSSVFVPGMKDREEPYDGSSKLEVVVIGGIVQVCVVADIAFISFKLDTEPDMLNKVFLTMNVVVERSKIASIDGDVTINLLLEELLPFFGNERIVGQFAARPRVFFKYPFVDLQAKLVGHVVPTNHLGYGLRRGQDEGMTRLRLINVYKSGSESRLMSRRGRLTLKLSGTAAVRDLEMKDEELKMTSSSLVNIYILEQVIHILH